MVKRGCPTLRADVERFEVQLGGEYPTPETRQKHDPRAVGDLDTQLNCDRHI